MFADIQFANRDFFFCIASLAGEYPEVGKVTTSYKDSISSFLEQRSCSR